MVITVADKPEERTYRDGPWSAPPPDATPETLAAYEAARKEAVVVRYIVRPCDGVDIPLAIKRLGLGDEAPIGPHENVAILKAVGERCITKILEATKGGEPVRFRRRSNGVTGPIIEATDPAAIPLALIAFQRLAVAAGDEAFGLMNAVETERGNS